MPRKKTTKTAPRKINRFEEPVLESSTPVSEREMSSMPKMSSSMWKYIIILLVVVLAVLAFKFKNLFIVATVDGQPITRIEYEKELNSKYGAQVLDNIISEKMILSKAREKGITINQSEIDAKIKEIEDRLKGKISLDEALKAQGLTKDTFQQQIEIQMTIDKMFDKEASVSEKDIDDYISQNKQSLPESTDPAALRVDVRNNLKQQKIGELFDKWFADVKKNSKVQKY